MYLFNNSAFYTEDEPLASGEGNQEIVDPGSKRLGMDPIGLGVNNGSASQKSRVYSWTFEEWIVPISTPSKASGICEPASVPLPNLTELS